MFSDQVSMKTDELIDVMADQIAEKDDDAYLSSKVFCGVSSVILSNLIEASYNVDNTPLSIDQKSNLIDYLVSDIKTFLMRTHCIEEVKQ